MSSKSISSQEPNPSFSLDDFAKALEQHDYNFEKGQVVRGKVFQYTSDGAYIDIGGKSPGFLPTKEVSLENITNVSEALPLNEEFDFLIIREENAEGQLILSRRQLAVKKAWDDLVEIAETGKSVQMRVTGSNKGGVIGEINGLRGFIPRSHLIEKEDLESLMGQSLTGTFLEIDPQHNKLVLSQREAARAAAITKLTKGALLEGKIVSIKPYGAFVDVEGITGLLHIKQISGSHIESLTTVLRIGQIIKVMILDIDEAQNRLSFSTKILENYPGEFIEKMDEVIATAEERAEKARVKMAKSE